MSQSEDIQAIDAYFKRTAAVNPSANSLKNEWTTWYNKLGVWDKNFDGNTLSAAKARRMAFNQANGQPEKVRPPAELLTPEEAAYWQKAGVNTTNMTPEEKFIAVNTVKPGNPVPKSMQSYVNTKGPATLDTGVAGYGTIGQGRANKKEDVIKWQNIIGVKADGIFGPGTTTATKAWQTNWNAKNPADQIKVDGIIGPQTWRRALVPTDTAAVSTPSILSALNPFSSTPTPATAPPVTAKMPDRIVVTKPPAPVQKPPTPAKTASKPPTTSTVKPAQPAQPTTQIAVAKAGFMDKLSAIPNWLYLAAAGGVALLVSTGVVKPVTMTTKKKRR